MVQVNGVSRAPGAPFGGVPRRRASGRESGIWGIRAFQEIKSISGVGGVLRTSIEMTIRHNFYSDTQTRPTRAMLGVDPGLGVRR